MSTFEMLKRSIEAKKNRGSLTDEYVDDTKAKMDVFLMNDFTIYMLEVGFHLLIISRLTKC